MLKKILHFIWIGNFIPKYVNFSIKAYQQINQDFNIHFVHYSIQKLQKIYFEKQINSYDDQIIDNLIDVIINKTKYKALIERQSKFLNQFGKIPFIQLFNDIYRLELLNNYGGIYVDCDTFPIKPFDETFLKNGSFCVQDKINENIISNNYFIAIDNSIYVENYFELKPFIQTNNFNISIKCKKPFEFNIRRIKFFTCKLSNSDFIDVNNSNYIEHYSDFRWSLKRTYLKSKFDKYFYL